MSSISDQPPIECDQFHKTVLRKRNTVNATFLWKIKGFKENREEYSSYDYIRSEDFIMKSPDGILTTWCLKIFPVCQSTLVKFEISANRDVTAKVDVSLLSSTSQKKLFGSCEKREFAQGQEFEILNCNYSSIIDVSRNLLPNGEMTVVCDITITLRLSLDFEMTTS